MILMFASFVVFPDSDRESFLNKTRFIMISYSSDSTEIKKTLQFLVSIPR